MTLPELKQQRENHLEELKSLANKYLSENKKVKDTHEHKWESEVIENNIKQLKRIITNANKALERKVLEKHATEQLRQFENFRNSITIESESGETFESYMTKMMYGVERFEVLTYSPSFSIVYDLFWIPDGTIGEQHDVAIGKQPPEIYEKYCINRISIIEKEMIPYLLAKPPYHQHAKLLKDIINTYKRSSFLFINIVLITAAESLVRELCAFVYAKQNPSTSREEVQTYIYDKFNSLETLINKADWREDIPTNLKQANAESRFIIEPSLNKSVALMAQHKQAEELIALETEKIASFLEPSASHNIPLDDRQRKVVEDYLEKIKVLGTGLIGDDTQILVTIRARLQFLLRRYKEDRNAIIHGNYAEFDKGWKTYVYLSAITKIFDLIKEYDLVYP